MKETEKKTSVMTGASQPSLDSRACTATLHCDVQNTKVKKEVGWVSFCRTEQALA